MLLAGLTCPNGTLLKAQDPGGLPLFTKKKEEALARLKKQAKADTARANALVRLLATATFQKEHGELLPYGEELMQLSRRLGYPFGLAQGYFAAANYLKSTSEYAKALSYYDSTLSVISRSDDPRLVRLKPSVFERQGMIFFTQENYYPALNSFFEILKLNDGVSMEQLERAYNFIAESYYHLNNLGKAAEFSLKNIELVESDSSSGKMTSSAYLMYINICLARNDLSSAGLYLEKLQPYTEDPRQILVSYGYYLKKGQLCYDLRDFKNAYSNYRKAHALAVSSGHSGSISASLSFLSRTASRLGLHEEAGSYAMENLALAENLAPSTPKIEALMNLATYYHATGDDGQAFGLASRAMELKDTMIAEINLRQVNLLGAIYERETQQRQISGLLLQKEQQEAMARQSRLFNKVFAVFIVMLLIFGYLGFTNFRKGQLLAQKQQELQQQKIIELEKDRQLVGVQAMMKGQEEERCRIAKDLHDSFSGLLSGAKMSFLNVRERIAMSDEDRILFERSLSILDNTIGDLRKVAHNLMPEALVKFGLHDALRDFCDYIQDTTGLRILFQEVGGPQKLDSTAEMFIYRIVQELVNNVVRHAAASQVIVQVAMAPGKTEITVEDDGSGFDPAILETTKGAGLANVRYRVQSLNGKTDIVSMPGRGTSVNIELIT